MPSRISPIKGSRVSLFCFLIFGLLLAGTASAAPAYPKDVGPYEVIVFEQPNFVGSYRPFSVAPGKSQRLAPELGQFNDNIRSILVGSKVAVMTFEDANFSGMVCRFENSVENAETSKKCASSVGSIGIANQSIGSKASSLAVYLKENGRLVGVHVSGHSGQTFYPVNEQGVGTTEYQQLVHNDDAQDIKIELPQGNMTREAVSVELYKDKNFKGAWIRLPGAKDSPDINWTSYILKDYQFAKKASSLRISLGKRIAARSTSPSEAAAAAVPATPPKGIADAAKVPAKPLKPAQLPAGSEAQGKEPPAQLQPDNEMPAVPSGPAATLPTVAKKPVAVKVPPAGGKKGGSSSLQFNPGTLVVSEFKGGWAVMDSADPKKIAIAFFKKERKADADKALQIMQHYGMNQKEGLGDSGFTLFLTSGKAPEGNFPEGGKCQVFDPQAITVEQRSITSKSDPTKVTGSYWAIMNGPRQLWGFRNDEARAREARTFIRQYGFTSLCSAGGFSYWHK